MRTLVFGAIVLARLALAPEATAQDDPRFMHPMPPRLEIGGAVSLIWVTPTVGMLASLPASARTSLEGGVNLTTRAVLSQAQLRVLIGASPLTRRSLVVGLTYLSRRGDTPGSLQTGLGAIGGVSWQAPLAGAFDLRADLQLLVPFRDGPGADPRAVMAFVWHR